MSTDSAFLHPSFVGRDRELGELTAAFEEAASGRGRLMMVVGEPGIGKTALCEQLGSFAEEHGGLTLVGHCYEEGSLSLPYLGFVEALRTYVRNRAPEDLRNDLGPQAGDLARILPEIQDRLQVEPRPAADPEDDRYRLLQATAAFLRNISDVQPLVVVLEDLHDADKGTLDVLTYLSRTLGDFRMLVVGTYRDVEVDRAHPLSGTLADLRRASSFGRTALRGLDPDEVQRMMSGVAGQDVAWGLAEAVHRQTEGNPLFVQEVVRYLVEEGFSTDGSWDSTGRVAFGIPEGLRDVIGRRLSRLSPECNEVMGIAAVIGREFGLDVLQQVVEMSEDSLFGVLKEAQAASIIEERSALGAAVCFRFAHAFFRQTLYEEIFAPLRIRFHQQVGRAMEEAYAGQLEEHAAELADHFANSSSEEDLTRALGYSEMAARHAQSVYSYGEAARLLEQALKVQQVLDRNDRPKQCDLLLSLGEALMPAGEPRQVMDVVAAEAFALAEAMDDRGRAARSCRLALEAAWQYGASLPVVGPEGRRWVERADQYAEPDSTDRVLTDLMLAFVRWSEGDIVEVRTLGRRALELARRLDDLEILYFATVLFVEHWTPREQEERWQLVTEMADHPQSGVTAKTLGFWLYVAGSACLDWGERARAEMLWEQVVQLAQRTDDATVIVRSLFLRPWLDYIDGRLEEAISGAEHLRRRADELGAMVRGQWFAGLLGLRPLINLGRGEEAIAAVRDAERLAEVEGASQDFARSDLLRAHLGPSDQAAAILRRRASEVTQLQGENISTPLLIEGLELAVLVEDRELCSDLVERLASVAFLSTAHYVQTCPARHLGAAAALLGEPDKARAYYIQALEAAGKIRFRPEIALTHLQLAELLLESYPDERAEALEHLEFAIAEFQEMKMQPSLERALKLQDGMDSLKAHSVPYPDGLSPREVEVLRLIAQGKSNRQIAEELFLSPSTIAHNVTSILTKTGSANRAEAATYATRHDLT